MSYFSESEDDERDSIVSGGDNSDDEPLNPPKKNSNKVLIDDELVDEDVDVDENIIESDDENESDIDMTDTDGEGDIEEEEEDEEMKEEMKSESKKGESKKEKEKSKKGKSSVKKILQFEDNDDEDDDDYENDNYLQKFNEGISKNYILNNHPECVVHNYNEVLSMCQLIKDANGIIIDDLHKTIPYLTKYERTRILGIRAKQINCDATPFIKLPEGIIDGYVIAEMELKEKKIPFIIRRPMPNGGSEYWFLKDLEDLSY
jgi:DNA-directed RNA polymerase I, II, and III subunit RPABC2